MILISQKNCKVKVSSKVSKQVFHKIMIKMQWKEAFIMIKNHYQNKDNLVSISLMIEQNHRWNSIKEI